MEPTNASRAQAAASALETYAREKGMEWEDDQSRLGDLLADLMHFAAQHGGEDITVDFERALTSARMHFDAEQS